MQAELDKDAIEASLAAQIEADKNPTQQQEYRGNGLDGHSLRCNNHSHCRKYHRSSNSTPKDDEWIAKLYKFVDLLAVNIGKAKQ